MYTNVLVPVDGSSHSERAVREGARLARQSNAKLTLIHVLPPVHKTLYTEGHAVRDTREEKDRARAEAENRGRDVLGKAAAISEIADVRQELAVNEDGAYEAILAAARKGGCDVIVMGTRGYSGIAGTLVGSQTQKVLAKATVPVLVVH
jgi:nucleotide-binding universal stress UspA family protein